MSSVRHPNDAIHFYINELTARVVAESGIPTDIHHLGKIILKGLKEAPDVVLQIDGATGQSETSGQCLKRTIKCAIWLKNMGFKRGDVMVLMAPNHLDLAVPFYAALALGITISPVDRNLKVPEIRNTFEITKPKIIFCQSENIDNIEEALRILSTEAKIVTFDKGGHDCCFSEILDSVAEDEIENFRPADFDSAETYAILIPTSGTTGPSKSAATTHKNFAITVPYFCRVKSSLIVSPIQWLSALIHYISSPYLKITRIQTSAATVTREHAYYLINKYKPQYLLSSPTSMTTLLKPGYHDKCDFKCIDILNLAGSAVHKDLIDEIKKITPNTEIVSVYGMSESCTIVFIHGYSSPVWSCGKPIQAFLTKLVDIESGKVINEPNVRGELLIKGPGVFKGYYNSPKATEEAFEDGWFKTGDIFYRDEQWNFYFVDRIKLLLKYKNYQISPVELESVILQHPKVLDVAVSSVQDAEGGDLAVGCVIPKPGCPPTAEEIKELVRENLTDSKQLRGGVVFLNHFPTTTSGKVHRTKLRELVLTMERE